MWKNSAIKMKYFFSESVSAFNISTSIYGRYLMGMLYFAAIWFSLLLSN